MYWTGNDFVLMAVLTGVVHLSLHADTEKLDLQITDSEHERCVQTNATVLSDPSQTLFFLFWTVLRF